MEGEGKKQTVQRYMKWTYDCTSWTRASRGSAALEILTYFALLLKHHECSAMEMDQPHQVPLLEIRRYTASVFVAVTYQEEPGKIFCFHVPAREGGG